MDSTYEKMYFAVGPTRPGDWAYEAAGLPTLHMVAAVTSTLAFRLVLAYAIRSAPALRRGGRVGPKKYIWADTNVVNWADIDTVSYHDHE